MTDTDWPAIIQRLRQQSDHLDETVRRQELATAYNNYGVSLSNQGHFDEAQQQLEEAMRLDPTNTQLRGNLATVELNIAQDAYQAQRVQDAKDALSRVLELNPNAAEAYALLGEVEYGAQRLKEAKAAWQKALQLDGSLEQVRARLDQLNRELPVESHFERVSQFYFDVRFTEKLENPLGYDVRDDLLRARREVGSDFALWPKHKIVVLVYSAEEFRQLRQETPDWVGGQYDGKIRVPVPSRSLDRAAVTRVLFHEYTHALVHDLTHDRCPTWWNEGLAEYEAWKAGRPPWPLLRAALGEERLIPWSDLSAKFSNSLSAKEVGLAYEQAHSIVQYLVDRYGFWRIRKILQAIDDSSTLEAALAKQYPVKPAKMESDWKAWLRERLASS